MGENLLALPRYLLLYCGKNSSHRRILVALGEGEEKRGLLPDTARERKLIFLDPRQTLITKRRKAFCRERKRSSAPGRLIRGDRSSTGAEKGGALSPKGKSFLALNLRGSATRGENTN